MAKMPRGAKLIYNPSSAAQDLKLKMFVVTRSTFDTKFYD